MKIMFAIASIVPILILLLLDSSLFPLPWPDDSAFILAGVDWWQGSGIYRMFSQSPFVRTYDQHNFNTMPLLPVLTGLLAKLGVDSIRGMRVPGALAFGLFATGLGYLRYRRLARTDFRAKAEAALFMSIILGWPIFRWGFGVLRPEVWNSLTLLALLLVSSNPNERIRRVVSTCALAAGAYIHFEAIYWVPVAMVVLLPDRFSYRELDYWKTYACSLLKVAAGVLLLLSPWLIYALTHFDAFQIQFSAQFGRLSEGRTLPTNLRALVDLVFSTTGNPVGIPKSFNPVKWAAIVLAAILIFPPRLNQAWDRTVFSAWIATGSAGLLWCRHPEMWFSTLLHAAFFGLLAIRLTPTNRFGIPRLVGFGLCALLTTFSGYQQFSDAN
ncbi:MAG: hypothetical protein AAB425_14180, partial [Bdellovibrionota bacterium]